MSEKNSNGISLPTMQRDKLVMQPEQPVYISSYAYLENEFARSNAALKCSITVEIREINTNTYFKTSNL